MNPVRVNEKVIETFSALKINRAYSYMIATFNNTLDEIVLDQVGEKGASYSDIVDHLPKDDGRYVVVDMEYETNENPPRKTNKLVLFLWVPMSTPAKRRFSFASGNDAFKRECTGIQRELQPSDKSELDYETVRKELLKA